MVNGLLVVIEQDHYIKMWRLQRLICVYYRCWSFLCFYLSIEENRDFWLYVNSSDCSCYNKSNSLNIICSNYLRIDCKFHYLNYSFKMWPKLSEAYSNYSVFSTSSITSDGLQLFWPFRWLFLSDQKFTFNKK